MEVSNAKVGSLHVSIQLCFVMILSIVMMLVMRSLVVSVANILSNRSADMEDICR